MWPGQPCPAQNAALYVRACHACVSTSSRQGIIWAISTWLCFCMYSGMQRLVQGCLFSSTGFAHEYLHACFVSPGYGSSHFITAHFVWPSCELSCCVITRHAMPHRAQGCMLTGFPRR